MLQSAPFNYRRLFIWISRIVLAAIFIYAGYAKITMGRSPRPPLGVALTFFEMQVDSYQILPVAASRFVAHTLPFVEIAIGVFLLAGWQLRIWVSLITVLIGGFFFSVLRAFVLHLEINCGCFAKPEPLTGMTVLRDGLLFALAIVLTVFVFQDARNPHPWSATEKAS
jgi:uncharacterized membrane protein YphA (DoxX/SURF4 family)